MSYKNLLITIVLIILISGCTQEQASSSEHRIYISSAGDDGSAAVLKAFMPNMTAGFVLGNAEDLMMGFLLGGTNEIIARAYFRFNISDWNEEDATFHLLTTTKTVGAGLVEVYVINDFGSLPLEQSNNPLDVSSWWNLQAAGSLIGEYSPTTQDRLLVTIPSTLINEYKEGDYLALMIKLVNESKLGDYYVFASYDYGKGRDNDNYKPYLTYE